ncbi:MAG: hypothetical protein U9Q96_02920 [Patescibacteria group bacterium]|nr:hypothetical protein [Patescibacteria group bacterium]
MINRQKGAILYFTIVIMSILLAAVFSIGSVVLVQIKTIREAGDSVMAFYAADTGIETALNDIYDSTFISDYGPIFIDGPSYTYEVWVTQPDVIPLPLGGAITPSADCTGDYYCIKSIGTYGNIKRAIEVKG